VTDRLDFFAAFALQGLLSSRDATLGPPPALAKTAFAVAREMLRERERIDREIKSERESGAEP
jgi:hypothetical protein